MHRAAIISHGLWFYTPSIVDGVFKNALDMYEWLLAQPEEDPPRIPQWPGFSPKQLRANHRNAVVAGCIPWTLPITVPPGFFLAGLTSDDRVVLLQERPGFG